MLTCKWCNASGTREDFEIHPNGFGYWCECDGFTFFDPKEHDHRRLLLLLEEKNNIDVRVDSSLIIPKMRKHLSPLRYPGGKSKLIDYLYSQLCKEQLNTFVEVFAGGASLGLALLDAGIVQHLILNDKDPGVYAFWRTMLDAPNELIQRIRNITPTHSDLSEAKRILSSTTVPTSDVAWSFLLANRLSYSGIIMANPQGGKGGSQDELLARWNPKTLEKRILHVYSLRDKITLYNLDYFDFIVDYAWWGNSQTLFIDPPYFRVGHKLYPTCFKSEDHRNMAELIQNLYREFPSADVVITYDNHPVIREIYPLANQEVITRKYFIQ